MIKRCCFTGHRPKSLPWGDREEDRRCRDLKDRLRREIRRLYQEEGVVWFLSGMAQGVDTWAAEAVLEARRIWPDIVLECAIPYPGQAALWDRKAQARYAAIVTQCDCQTVLCQHYAQDCFFLRNRYMVDASQFVVAVWNGAPGGTGYTVNYARRQRRQVILLPPVLGAK